ncbi:hypothetical protein OS493_008018 [Desmophyllum pertusum]|uniref:Uncharacterized protein n=1 Tax=Desmophyllum pertusum TaxID=174260 RepID=A0A9W9YF19_9CNID|nr:hypothetical protein OS493_008018 [Desmophyllum pertusum]
MEELASGIAVDDLTEKEVLIEELIEKEETIGTLPIQQKKDKDAAEDIRKKAMESMGETRKRKSSGGSTDDDQPRERKTPTKRCAQPLIDFLQDKTNSDRELHQQELEIKKKEQENQQEMIQSMMLQQQQMNQAFLSVVHKLLEK